MKLRTVVYILLAIIVVGGGYFLVFGFPEDAADTYRFATVTRGAIENTVSATGTLSPVTTVEVGTQVSGTIDSVYVNFNDIVREGQVLVVLDTLLLKAAVVDAEANLERSQVQLELAITDHKRSQSLYDQEMIPEADFLTSQSQVKVQQATIRSSEASLQRARRNLGYAVIKSPINGIVIERNVEAGQTVAASLSTPTLFIIAQNLSQMEILAEVDESDIGEIEQGQSVRYEVAAYADKQFTGSVKQVRLQPRTISNVVTYTVVVETSNDEGVLLPGMTATIDFITDRCSDVLMIPNKALRFQPSAEIMEAYFERRRAEREQRMGDAGDSTKPGGMVWYIDSLGQMSAAPLRTGISDGTNTEVLASRVLTEGMEIIVGFDTGEPASNRQQTGFRPPRRGF
jgi:HlyD family secretion protein